MRFTHALAAAAALSMGCHYITIGEKKVDPGAAGGGGEGAAGGAGAMGAGDTGGDAGAGATGGGSMCEMPEDCPGAETECRGRTCVDQMCGMAEAAPGTPCDENGGQVCDGAGTCVGCLEDEDCDMATAYCDDQQCSPKAVLGAPCDGDAGCLSGACVDDVCCESTCVGLCEACAESLNGEADGTCAPVVSATDPQDECSGALACDGCGACEPDVWSRTYGDMAGVAQRLVTLAVKGDDIFVAGRFDGTIDLAPGMPFTSPDTQEDIFVARLEPCGDHVWSKRFGGIGEHRVDTIAVDDNSDLVLFGEFLDTSVSFDGGTTTLTAESWDVYVTKLDADGAHQWSYDFGNPSTQLASDLAIDAQNDIVLTGVYIGTLDFGSGTNLPTAGGLSGYVGKLTSAGGYVFQTAFVGNQVLPQRVAVDSNGDAWVTGKFTGTTDFLDGNGNVSAASEDAFLVKLDGDDGSTVDRLIVGGAMNQTGRVVVVDSADNVYVAGILEGDVSIAGGPTLSAGAGSGMYVAKLDSDGNHLWSTSFASTTVIPNNGALDAAGGLVLTGWFEGSLSFGGDTFVHQGDDDMFVVKLDGSDGSHLFSHAATAPGQQVGFAVGTDSGNRILVGGTFENTVDFGDGDTTSAGGLDAFLLKLVP